jgi:hypothetical protein
MNLKARYGDKYRVSREDGAEPNDPAGFIIPCKRGHIYRHSATLLGVATNGRGIVRRLLAVSGLRIVQDGSDGINATFAPAEFEAVAKIIWAKRRRRLSPEHRAKLAASNQAHRFASKASDSRARRDRTAADGQTADLAA